MSTPENPSPIPKGSEPARPLTEADFFGNEEPGPDSATEAAARREAEYSQTSRPRIERSIAEGVLTYEESIRLPRGDEPAVSIADLPFLPLRKESFDKNDTDASPVGEETTVDDPQRIPKGSEPARPLTEADFFDDEGPHNP